jgi:hypothetical protein
MYLIQTWTIIVERGHVSSVSNKLVVKCNSIDIVILIYFKRLPLLEQKKSNNLLKTVDNIVIYLPIILYIKFNPFLSFESTKFNPFLFFLKIDPIMWRSAGQ